MKLSLKNTHCGTGRHHPLPAALADTAKDGTVHITGLIKQNACTVKTDSVEVTLQEEFASLFTAAGQTAGDTDFTIETRKLRRKRLQQVYRRALKAHSTEPMRPSLKNEDDAENIGVQILDKTSTPMTFNDLQAWSAPVNLPTAEGVTELSMPFTARYISTAVPVKSGTVDATATFYLQYN
ncbi:fimbrial subunit [Salmonella enterica subsp. enterica]|nr:fimbrial subunit [Salmonella enterica subsp. enterica]